MTLFVEYYSLYVKIEEFVALLIKLCYGNPVKVVVMNVSS